MVGKHTYILQDENLWLVKITVVQVGGDKAIFHLCILAVLVLVYLTETLKSDFKAFQVNSFT